MSIFFPLIDIVTVTAAIFTGGATAAAAAETKASAGSCSSDKGCESPEQPHILQNVTDFSEYSFNQSINQSVVQVLNLRINGF